MMLQMRSISVKQVLTFRRALVDVITFRRSSDKACEIACSILQLSPGPQASFEEKNDWSDLWSEQENTICLAAQFLNAAFVSYMQGHCGSFKFFFLEHEITGLSLGGANGGLAVVMSLQRLACLDNMLDGQNVMVFHSTDRAFPTNKHFEASRPWDVLATADDLVDTWGPGNMILKRNNPNEAGSLVGLTLRGGVIHAQRGRHHHWTPLAEFNEDAIAGEWDRSEKIRVGAQIDVNPCCATEERDHLQALEGLWKPLGTRQAYWKEQERQIGLQGGQYVTMVQNSTWDKVPGVSLKKQLLSNLSNKTEYFAFLNACCGLQVSACSGIARRITMRELLSDLLPTFVLRQAPVPMLWHNLVADFEVIETLAGEDFTPCQRMFTSMSEANPEYFLTFWRLALDLVKSLEFTGLQPVGDDFVLGFVPSEAAEYLRRVSVSTKGENLWLKVLRDSESSATFAYLTPNCLQLGGKGCQNATRNRQGHIHFLQTDVQRQVSGLSDKGIGSDNWHLKDKETHFFRAKDDNRDVVLSATVVRGAAFPDPRLLVKESLIPLHIIARMFRRQNQRYLQERLTSMPGARRTFITSSPEAEPWFT
jgi:hypothetical protein